ncbi:MAG TPA: hypothetical protein VGB02_06890 [Pyrinomonadaceae bacterium]|jgi:hypothetical protein
MRVVLFLPILILLISQSLNGQIKSENSPVEVLNSKWSKSRQRIENPNNQGVIPAESATTPGNRNLERNRRINDPVGTPDPKERTIEARSAALEKNMQDSRSPKSKSVDGFIYQARIRNQGRNTIEILFWEYQFKERENPTNVVSRQFLCGVQIKPDKEHELRVFSTFSPGSLISIESLENKSGSLFEEKILINRVEYADGTIWQRKGWTYIDMKPSIDRALATPWGLEMCRNL